MLLFHFVLLAINKMAFQNIEIFRDSYKYFRFLEIHDLEEAVLVESKFVPVQDYNE